MQGQRERDFRLIKSLYLRKGKKGKETEKETFGLVLLFLYSAAVELLLSPFLIKKAFGL